MILMGILEDLGKVIIGNIIKDIGKHLFTKVERGFINEKEVKADAFLKILDKHLEIKKEKNLDSIFKKLVKLELLIKNKKGLSEELKKEVIAKIKKMKNLIKNFKEKNEIQPIIGSFAQLANDNFSTIDDVKKELHKELKEITEIISKKIVKQKDLDNLKAEIKKVFIEKRGKKEVSDVKNRIKEVHTKNVKNKNEDIFKKIVKEIKVHENNPEKLLKLKSELAKLLHNKHEIVKNFEPKSDNIEKLIKKKVNNLHHKSNYKLSKIKSELSKIEIKHEHNDLKKEFSNNSNLASNNQINFQTKEIKANLFSKIEHQSKQLDFEKKVMLQIKKGIIANNIKHEITIKLHPPELGKVHIKLAMINNELTAKITAEHVNVKNVIMHNFNILQDALKEKGIILSNFQVSVAGEFKEHEGKNSNSQKENKQKKFNFSEIAENFEDFGDVWNVISEIEEDLMLNLKI